MLEEEEGREEGGVKVKDPVGVKFVEEPGVAAFALVVFEIEGRLRWAEGR